MSTPDAQTISFVFAEAIKAGIHGSARSKQAAAGQLGPSNIGFCRQKAALMTKGVKATDSTPVWAAGVGTAIHNFVESIIKVQFPDWIVEQERVTATLPNGAEVSGTPDIVAPDWNAIIDLKTKDGLEYVARYGSDQSNKFQRHLYLLGAIEKGWLDPTKPIYVCNVYLDRSGATEMPYVEIEEADWSLTDQISSWIDDVTYAVVNNEDAERDVAAPVCEKICEFFTACRGSLPDENSEYISDPELVGAIDMYVEGQRLEKEAKRLKDEAKAMLVGVSGSTGRYQARWTYINGSQVPSFERAGYERLDVRKVRS
jgi:hypothetical protein